MVTLEAILPMMSEIASRTMSCTMRTITEATVSPPEIAPATSPVMRRCDAEPAWRDLNVATARDSCLARRPVHAVSALPDPGACAQDRGRGRCYSSEREAAGAESEGLSPWVVVGR